jgi:hypothetical protein
VWRGEDPGFFDRGRAALAALILALLVAYEFWPSKIKLDTPVIGLVALLVVLVALPLIEELTLPGGVSAKLRERLQDAKPSVQRLESGDQNRRSAADVARETDGREKGGEGPDEFTSRDDPELSLPDYLSRLAGRQPAATLLALRAELEDRLRATYVELYGASAPRSLVEVIRRLLRDEYIDDDQADVALSLIEIGNEAAHARRVGSREAKQAVRFGNSLVSSIRTRTLEAARAFEDQVADVLSRIEGAEVRRNYVLTRVDRRSVAADFVVELNSRRYVIEVKYADERRAVHNRIKEGELVAALAIPALQADAAIVVLPDDVAPAKQEVFHGRVRVVALSDLPAVLRSGWPEQLET